MATIEETLGTIDRNSNELVKQIIGTTSYSAKLLSEASAAQGGGASINVANTPIQSYIGKSPITLPSNLVDNINKIFEDIATRLTEYSTLINSAKKPENADDLGDPLDGWVGVDKLDPWTDLKNLDNVKYTTPLLGIATTLINRLKTSSTVKGIEHYLRIATAHSIGILNNIIGSRAYGATRCFMAPNILNQSSYNMMSREGSFQQVADARFIQFVIESTAKDFAQKAVKYGIDLDKIGPKAAIVYGEAYCVIADYTANKAQREVRWFMNDYEARMKAQSANVEMNVDHYTKYIESVMYASTKYADANIKAAINDFTNTLKLLTNTVDVQLLDTEASKVYNEAALLLYGVTLNDIVNKFENASKMYIADKTNTLTSYSTLLQGYRSLMGSMSQDVVAVVSTKQS